MVSKKYCFVFVHIPKTGGSSITEWVKDWVFGSHEETYLEGQGWQRSFHYRRSKMHLPPSKQNYQMFPRTKYLYFAVMRNPWDRIVSIWSSIGPERGIPYNELCTLEQFLEGILKNEYSWPVIRVRQVDMMEDWYHMIRFENLEQGIRNLSEKLSLPFRHFPHRLDRKDPKHYSEYYTPATRDLVTDIYAADIEKGGYSFEQR